MKETLISINYNGIVCSYFNYWCKVWDVLNETQSKRLQKLQNRAARIILDMSNEVVNIQSLCVHWVGNH